MRILIENGTYELRNVGDVAMLQVAVERLQGAFPKAQLQVLTKDPARLKRFCPGAVAVDAHGQEALLEARLLPIKSPARLARLTRWSERRARAPFLGALRRRAARLAARQSEVGRARTLGQNQSAVNAFWQALLRADVVVGTGGGYLTDAFENHTLNTFDMLLFAARRGKVTTLVGQGIGPLKARLLQDAARQTLCRLDLITLREGIVGEPLCRELGVPPERLRVTGDDAIGLCRRLARQNNSHAQRIALGVNVRVSGYSGVTPAQLIQLRQSLVGLSQSLPAPLLGTPISTYETESDSDSIARLLQGESALLDEGRAVSSPAEAVAQIARCRAVVTGSYHAGVFALSQGIPVVALVASAYYADKFGGLAAQFPSGCHIIRFDQPDWEAELQGVVRTFWNAAAELGQTLQDAGQAQEQRGLEAYQTLFEIIEARAASAAGDQQ